MLEIACFNAVSAAAAARAGADRIELCANYAAAGTTPSLATLLAVRGETDKLIHVMVRPRGGDFNYSAAEVGQMRDDVETFKASGAVDGFVFGILDEAGCVDEEKNAQLVSVAAPLPCTFHRAIDEVEDLDGAVETVVKLGFSSILTSGGARSASEGVDVVAGLQEKYGGQISLILGGGIRRANVQALKCGTGVEWVHSAAITGGEEMVDEEEVRSIVALLRGS